MIAFCGPLRKAFLAAGYAFSRQRRSNAATAAKIPQQPPTRQINQPPPQTECMFPGHAHSRIRTGASSSVTPALVPTRDARSASSFCILHSAFPPPPPREQGCQRGGRAASDCLDTLDTLAPRAKRPLRARARVTQRTAPHTANGSHAPVLLIRSLTFATSTMSPRPSATTSRYNPPRESVRRRPAGSRRGAVGCAAARGSRGQHRRRRRALGVGRLHPDG